MSKASKSEIIPIDIRSIRQSLGLGQKDMGRLIAERLQPFSCTPIPETRIAEWEMGWRPVPDYVYTAVAKVLLDNWSDDRHLTPVSRQREVDLFYGKVLNPPLGEMFRLEQELAQSRHPRERRLEKKARQVRIAHMKYLQDIIHIEMNYIFDPDPGGIAPLEDVA